MEVYGSYVFVWKEQEDRGGAINWKVGVLDGSYAYEFKKVEIRYQRYNKDSGHTMEIIWSNHCIFFTIEVSEVIENPINVFTQVIRESHLLLSPSQGILKQCE